MRHVYGGDVVQAIMRAAENDLSKGCAYNIGQDETLSLVQFLELLARPMHCPLKIVRVPREELNRQGLLPHCSPFSGYGCRHWTILAAKQNWAWSTRRLRAT